LLAVAGSFERLGNKDRRESASHCDPQCDMRDDGLSVEPEPQGEFVEGVALSAHRVGWPAPLNGTDNGSAGIGPQGAFQ
jgi:hypothetical protein